MKERPLDKTRKASLVINFFDNGSDQQTRADINRIETAGYSVQCTPTSGASALWVNEYEVVGRTAIRNITEQLIKK